MFERYQPRGGRYAGSRSHGSGERQNRAGPACLSKGRFFNSGSQLGENGEEEKRSGIDEAVSKTTVLLSEDVATEERET